MLPVLSAVETLVNAVTVGDVAADAGFTRPDVNHVVVRFRDCNGSDRRCALLVEDGGPHTAAIGGLPYSAGDGAEVIIVRLAGNARHSEDAAATEWSHIAPLHRAEKFLIVLRLTDLRRWRGLYFLRLLLRLLGRQLLF